MKNKLAKTIGKYLTNSSTSGEDEALKEWINSSEKNKQNLKNIKDFWQAINKPAEEPEHTKSVYSHLQYRLNKPNTSKKISLLKWQVAATILLCISVGLGINTFLNQNLPTANFTLKTEKGQRSSAELPDGTKVWLNADTELRIENFLANERKVILTGEAQFDVAHNKNKPFIVIAQDIRITVLGTKFNVKAYENEEIIKASLMEGSINLFRLNDSSHKQYLLSPGQSALYTKKDHSIQIKEHNILNDISWREGVLNFKSIPFNQLMRVIERNYNVEINYQHKDFDIYHYTGTIDNMEISKVFEMLSYSIPLKFEMKKNKIIIKPSKKE